ATGPTSATSAPGASAPGATTGPEEAPAPSTDAFPVTVTNCGETVTVPAPPERLVTIKSSTTELALALGLADRIVAAAFLDGPLDAEVDAAGADLTIL